MCALSTWADILNASQPTSSDGVRSPEPDYPSSLRFVRLPRKGSAKNGSRVGQLKKWCVARAFCGLAVVTAKYTYLLNAFIHRCGHFCGSRRSSTPRWHRRSKGVISSSIALEASWPILVYRSHEREGTLEFGRKGQVLDRNSHAN